MAKKSAVVVAPLKPNPEMIKKRAEGMTLIAPLRPKVVSLNIQTEEHYLLADALLSEIKTKRAIWATKVDPIREPILKAIEELKLSMAGVKALDDEVDSPLAMLEADVKQKMKDYKVLEAVRIREAKQLQDESARLLREEAQKKLLAETAAKTPQMKAKLAEARANLETQAQIAEMPTHETTAVRGVSSTSRTVQKVRIKDLDGFLNSLASYQPVAGVYKMGVPPVTLLTMHTKRDGEQVPEGSAVDKIEAEIAKIYSTQPGVVASWPGVELYDDVIIAGR